MIKLHDVHIQRPYYNASHTTETLKSIPLPLVEFTNTEWSESFEEESTDSTRLLTQMETQPL